MASIIGVGDNVVDKYLDLGLMFPGGNALNVAVLAKRHGARTAYIGAVGSDEAGRHIFNALKSEGVDVSHMKVINGPNAYAAVTLKDGDRVFVGGDKGVSFDFTLTCEDYDFISGFDIIHSSVYSGIENEMKSLKEKARMVSFDFSDKYDDDYLNEILPYVDFAFFSGSHKSLDEIKYLQREFSKKGPKLILITRGAEGAVLYYNGRYYLQPSVPAKVVDTLGAGDAFIACLIVNLLNGKGVEETLNAAANAAAETCGHYGAFGYGIKFEN